MQSSLVGEHWFLRAFGDLGFLALVGRHPRLEAGLYGGLGKVVSPRQHHSPVAPVTDPYLTSYL